jgi:membrane complex biogenesis BtpA family protein
MTRHSLAPIAPGKPHAVIGMLHLPALPGAPLARSSLTDIARLMVADAKALTEGGVDALMMENFGDVPFYPGRVPAEVVAMMTSVAIEIRRVSSLPLGINVLRNDGLSALGIAVASNASFVRVNVLSGARVTDQGVIQGIAHDMLRLRRDLAATNIKILADVDVKHSAALAPRPLPDEVEDVVRRGLADGVIVSGSGTGKSVDLVKLQSVAKAAAEVPVILGSGVSATNIRNFMPHAWGFIVGTSLKHDEDVSKPVDITRVLKLMSALRI